LFELFPLEVGLDVSREFSQLFLLFPGAGFKPLLPLGDDPLLLRCHLPQTLAALLGRFDPAVLEARLSQGGLSNLLPAARKSRLWNEFCVLYGAIAAEAEDDFHSVFGRAFAKAYTEQSKERGGKPIT